MIFCLTEKSSHVVNISLTKIYFLNQSNQIANNDVAYYVRMQAAGFSTHEKNILTKQEVWIPVSEIGVGEFLLQLYF